jgi:hypothetical protein
MREARIRRTAYAVIAGTSLLCLPGCGEKPIEFGDVSGVVTVGGKKHANLVVRFLPEPEKGKELPINATGRTDAQGKYTLTHVKDGVEAPGAPVGWHRVLVEDASRGPTPQGQTPPPPLISPTYASPASTPIKKEVKPGAQTIDLEVTK